MSKLGKHRQLFKYTVIVLVLIVPLWALIGSISRTIDFWDDDPDRGATTVTQDLFGDSFTEVRYLGNQGWEPEDSLWFYNTSQGSNLIPYDFFLELEQADNTVLFRDNNNINAYRYLPQKPTHSNPEGLPVGMSKDIYKGKEYMGFTCAACHTSQLNYNGIGMRIDGGPAASDLVGFMEGLANAITVTLRDDNKKQRFIKAVLDRGNYQKPEEILADLDKYGRRLYAYNAINDPQAPGRPDTVYGYARLDAFGRIYNRVLEHILSAKQLRELLKTMLDADTFKKVMQDVEPILNGEQRDDLLAKIEKFLTPEQQYELRNLIFNPADAPVSYPFLWDIPQHDYVQWNGIVNNSGIGPMGRNAGQVIGVFGTLDWQQKDGFTLSSVLGGQGFGDTHVEFDSSVDIRNLRRVEDHIRELQSPLWPQDILPAFDQERLYNGEKLFTQYCDSCHQRIDRSSNMRRVIARMGNVNTVKTDPKMALNSIEFGGYSGILQDKYANLDIGNILLQKKAPAAALLTLSTRNVITTPDPDKWFIRRWAERIFDAMFTIFDNKIKPSLKQGDYTPDTTVKPVASLTAYKARSLNGIWATAPYLHNGSVPTLYDLLLPKKQPGDPEDGEYRPDTFVVGSREFDPVKVGIRAEGYDGFVFDTSILGNHNTGHEYAAGNTPQPNGKTLPPLTREQRLDLLEYLKTL